MPLVKLSLWERVVEVSQEELRSLRKSPLLKRVFKDAAEAAQYVVNRKAEIEAAEKAASAVAIEAEKVAFPTPPAPKPVVSTSLPDGPPVPGNTQTPPSSDGQAK